MRIIKRKDKANQCMVLQKEDMTKKFKNKVRQQGEANDKATNVNKS